MKKLFFLILPILIYAQTYQEILNDLDNSLQLKSAKELEKSAKLIFEAKKGENLPDIELSLNSAWLKDEPTVNFLNSTYPFGTKQNFTGSLKLTYPIFTGYAISSEIKKSNLMYKQTSLKVLDLKRNLYLRATELFGAIYSLEKTLNAKIEAKKAIISAYNKAKGFYDNGMIPLADLYNIEAKKYEIEADITDTKNQKNAYLNQLRYLLNKQISSIEFKDQKSSTLNKDNIISTALKNREDIRALKYALEVNKEDENLAKSRFYPKLALVGEFKKQGDTLSLNGNGFSNADQSYIATNISWNIFNGYTDKKQYEASRYKTLSATTTLEDYKNLVKTEIENSFLTLEALKLKLKSANMEFKAQKEYNKLIQGRFDNQLSSADELSRSIANLSSAKAKVSVLKSQIFIQEEKIKLMAGLNYFILK
jgi:outer membrane protein TolC